MNTTSFPFSHSLYQNQAEILGAQIAGALIMIAISTVACTLLYGGLYLLPMQPFVWVAEK